MGTERLYLSAFVTRRVLVQQWLHLYSRIATCAHELLDGLTAHEKKELQDKFVSLSRMTSPYDSVVELSRLNHLHLTEQEQRSMGGIVNLRKILLTLS